MTIWNTEDAMALCREIEAIAPTHGAHVALTGGLLYKDGFFEELKTIGVEQISGFGWCHKAAYKGKPIDFFFPDDDGEYDPNHDTQAIEMETA